MKNSLLKPLLLAVLVLCGQHARADGTLTFTAYVDGAVQADITVGNYSTSAALGGFATSRDGSASFTSFCTDIFQTLSFGPVYTDYVAVPGSAHLFANSNANLDLGRLFSENLNLNSALNQAAFQIAVLEISYETSGSYDVGSGQISFNSAAAALANTWLAALPGQSNYRITVLESPTFQDVLFATQVPEPSSLALMAAGLLGLGIVSRRRRTPG